MVMTQEERQATIRLIDAYSEVDTKTGGQRWKPNTPEFVKQAQINLKEILDKPQESDIMTSRGEEYGSKSYDISTESSRPGGESTQLSQGVQTEGISGVEEVRGTSREPRGNGEPDTSARGEPYGIGGVREPSLESGDTPLDIGDRDRLATSKPKDIILDTTSDFGQSLGAAARFDNNLESIRTLKKLDAEERQATPEEQAILAKYSGFGDSAFNDAFRGYNQPPAWEARDSAQGIINAPMKGQISMMGSEPITKENISYGIINRQRKELGEGPIEYRHASVSKGLEKPHAGRARKTKTVERKPRKDKGSLKKVKATPMAELREISQRRSKRAQSQDLKRKHRYTITPRDKERLLQWARDQGNADIMGIDTPPGVTKRKKPSARKGLTPISQLRASNQRRSKRAQLLDKNQANKITISPRDKAGVKAWKRDMGSGGGRKERF